MWRLVKPSNNARAAGSRVTYRLVEPPKESDGWPRRNLEVA